MSISLLSNPYNAYGNYGSYGMTGGNAMSNSGIGSGGSRVNDPEAARRTGINPRKGKGPDGECETCKNRKYRDGSDEMVSFKTAQHMSPQNAASGVRAHEQEHVSNAYKKAAKDNGKVIRASVAIHTSICPECGRSYVSGGTTSTQIKYNNEENPYQKQLKATDHIKYAGMNKDITA